MIEMLNVLEISLKNNKRLILLIAMLFFIAKPGYISNISSGTFFGRLLIAGECSVYLFIVLKWIYNRKISLIFMSAALMYGLVLVSTVYNGGGLVSALKSIMGYIFMIMLMDNEIDNAEDLWRAGIIYLSLMICINFITIIIFPEGLYVGTSIYNGQTITTQPGWFFSVTNGLGKYVLYLLFFKADYDFRRYSKLTPMFFILAVISMVSLIIMQSQTSIFAAAAMLFILICAQLIKKMKPVLFSIYYLMGVLVVFFVLFVMLPSVGVVSGSFVAEVLGSSEAFHGRTPIWKSVIERILKRPVLGYGYISKESFRYLADSQAAVDAHNYYLTLGVFGGILAIIVFMFIIFIAIRSVSSKQYEYSGIVVTSFLFAFFLTMMFENTTSKLYWIIITYAFYLGKKQEMIEGNRYMYNDRIGWSLYL